MNIKEVDKLYNDCMLCPRKCRVDRSMNKLGFCGEGSVMRIGRYSLHMWEEPCISGKNGSGTVFFSGCSLGCAYCQNKSISKEKKGRVISEKDFEDICFELRERGAHNINLVTSSHFTPSVVKIISRIKKALDIPIVMNCGGYESPLVLEMMNGIADVYLVDFKYFSPDIAKKYSYAPDYPEVAKNAVDEMVKQTGKCIIDANGIMQRGVIVRHMVIPGCRKDSINVINYLGNRYSKEQIYISLMSQYTPNGAVGAPDRKITTFEYESVYKELEKYAFNGYVQDLESGNDLYIPEVYS